MSLAIISTKYDYAAAWLLYLAGATLEEVANLSKIPYSNLVQYSGSHDWRKHRGEAKKRAHESVRRDLKERVEKRREAHTHFMLDQLDESEVAISKIQIGAIDPYAKDPDKAGIIRPEDKLKVMDQHDLISRRVMGMDKVEAIQDATELGFMVLLAAKGLRAVEEEAKRDVLVNKEEENRANHEKVVQGHEVTQFAAPNSKTIEVSEDEPTTVSYNPPKEALTGLVQTDKNVIESEGNMTQHTTSAISPLPDATEANTGILRPFNGHINAPDIPQITPNAGDGAKEPEEEPANASEEPVRIKQLPSRINLVNKNELKQKDEDHPTDQ